ncbi:unnamed protein product [Clonostachys byssicola]|uniref:Uncharacterized protein n=1 Tax=Clonostachys byssicola TaxID=160290 RepID=A0A9N9UCL0_9HYPO|nr:unnamed protein product [Clonostachys byssicola]
MPREFQFVAVLCPTEPVPFETRKLTHSHARRETHAMKKRLRMQRLQAKATRAHAGNTIAVFDPSFLNVRIVVPHATATCHDLFSAPGDHQERVFREWVGLAVTDQDLLDTAVLLRAGRYLLETRPDDPVLPQMILLYKQRGLQRLRRLLSGMSSPVNALGVAMALSLAMDEDAFGEMGVARMHAEGVFNMVDLGGGPGSIGLTGFLQTMYEAWQQIFKVGRYLAP